MQNKPRAAIMMVFAATCMGTASLLAKLLGTGENSLHAFQISAGRFGFALLALGIAAAILRPRIVAPNIPLHVLRVLFGWAGITCMFFAVARMPMADATAISYLNPMIAMLLAIPLLGERPGRWRWGSVAVSFLGAMLLIRPGASGIQPAALVALAAACFMGAEVIAIKRLTLLEKPFQILLINNSIGCILAISTAAFVWVTPTSAQWLIMAGVGLSVVSAQICFIQALRAADASFVMPLFYGTLIVVALWDLALFGIVPDVISLIGGGIIVSAACVLAWRESRAA
ncbi:EamA-like transporter family protein [Monaibacterium marinum]|uniref:EamA-like transporter family protein n=1 Tax=Pontivivens marinum TaxID=1690039 RepID=A0A2C9CNL7_9RHOB|nr:DMT family transporter [Monaibacterium marinum]SOH92914.1 EamA-like transporter family protein [Monaibacterium marinum]